MSSSTTAIMMISKIGMKRARVTMLSKEQGNMRERKEKTSKQETRKTYFQKGTSPRRGV